jgi:hypothetical protein
MEIARLWEFCDQSWMEEGVSDSISYSQASVRFAEFRNAE